MGHRDAIISFCAEQMFYEPDGVKGYKKVSFLPGSNKEPKVITLIILDIVIKTENPFKTRHLFSLFLFCYSKGTPNCGVSEKMFQQL